MAIKLMSSRSDAAAAAEKAVNRAARRAHAVVDRVAEKAGPAVARAAGGIGGASERLHSGVEQFAVTRSRLVGNWRTSVSHHPLTSVAAAVVAGLMLGGLIFGARRTMGRGVARTDESMSMDDRPARFDDEELT